MVAVQPKWIEISLVLLASWLVAGLFSQQTVQLPIIQQAAVNGTAAGERSAVDEALLNSVPLFGKQEAKKEAVKKPVVVTPSKLNVKLIGTIVAGGKSAAVLLLNGAGEHRLFFVGDTMQPNIKLHAVEATEITVDNNGTLERIAIEEGEKIASAPVSAMPQSRPPVARPQSRRPKVDRSIDRLHMEKQLRSFSTLMSQARVTPHFTDKKADGFMISEIVKGSYYEEVGLQNGDVIQKVNGEPVTSAEQAMRMYRELQNSTTIDVEINRGGVVQQITYTIN